MTETVFTYGAPALKFGDGASDEIGYLAAEKVQTVYDFNATILHLMGMDHKRLTYHYSGRDMRLTDVAGEVIEYLARRVRKRRMRKD